MPLRIIFCGTPEFAVPSLRRLLSDPEFAIAAVVTQPDRPRGRGQEVSASPVKTVALEAGLQVYQPEKIKSDSALDFFMRMAVDAVVIIAYGQIIPARLIALPRLGWINLHGSLLPKYRGAAPIAWAIANGETVTGLTSMQIDAGMDTGPMLLRHKLEIGPDETTPELASRMAEAGAPLIIETLGKLAREGDSADRAGLLASHLRAAARKGARTHRLVASGAANLQSHARVHAVAGRLFQLSQSDLPDLGTAG